jgi:DNA-binding GntR family transcriptional regulator
MPDEAETIAIDLSDVPGGADNGPRTLASAIYARVRAEILDCKFRPGEKVLIGPLGRRFNVSVSAVREALFRLVADGLIQAEDHRGFRVSPLSLVDLRDVTRTRVELECAALRLSILRGDRAWEHALKQAWDDLQSVPHSPPGDSSKLTEEWATMHGRYHLALVAACGLQWLMRFRATLYEQSERYRRLSLAVARRNRDRDTEHRIIFEATMARDVGAATAHLTTHLERTADDIAEHYRELGLTEPFLAVGRPD